MSVKNNELKRTIQNVQRTIVNDFGLPTQRIFYMAKGNDIQNRLIKFGARIIKVCNALPDNKAGKHVASQMLRSGTSPAPNYGEARAAESTKDFIHKLKVSVKELNETEVWLKMIIESELMKEEKLIDLIDEGNQLARILSASINTARKNLEKDK